MTVVLWHLPISHYSEKARWALDYKQIPHQLREPLPTIHRLTARILTRGRHGRLPVLSIDGNRIADSTEIIAALESYRPEPALYPAEPAERDRALALEDYFDEQLAPRVRRVFWHYTLDDPGAAIEAALPHAGPRRKALLLRGASSGAWLTRNDYGIDQASAAEALDGIRTTMTRLEAEIGRSGYLVGDQFSVADLSAAALFTPILAPPERPYAPPLVQPLREIREELERRDGGAWVTEVYARHRVLPPRFRDSEDC
jgi:glutathione S-transferase